MTTIHPAPSRVRAPQWVQVLAGMFERVGAQYLQALAILLVESEFFSTWDLGLGLALAVATLPAAMSALLSLATAAIDETSWPPLLQSLYRVMRSGAAAYVGFALAAPIYTLEVGLGAAARSAVALAVTAAVKAEVGKRFIGDRGTVAWLPKGWQAALPGGTVIDTVVVNQVTYGDADVEGVEDPDADPNAGDVPEQGDPPGWLLDEESSDGFAG